MIKKVLLRYSTQRATEPILASVIKQTGVLLNILYADITSRGGEILLSIDAPEQDVEKVIGLLKQRGVEVQELKRAIQLDEEKCFSCGACLSLCPTRALRLADDYSVKLEEDKCIYCEICVPSCPVQALKISKYG
jgi:NAD-dependent dihydropyrimidine dehydrogenase PreA subunit